MRKFFWILVMICVAGCGGGDGGSSDSGTPGVTPDTPTGKISLKFIEESTSLQKAVALPATEPGRARLVFSSTNLHFKKIVDLAFGTTLDPLTLPVATDYKIQAIFYAKGTPNELSSYGASSTTVSVSANGTTQVELLMKHITVTLQPPPEIYSGLTYDVPEPSAGQLAEFCLQNRWSLTVRPTPITTRPHLTQTPSTEHKGLTAPAVTQQGFLYMQGEFLIKADLLDVGESTYDWTFVTEPATPTALKLAAIDLPIELPSDTAKPVIHSFSLPTWKLTSTTIAPIALSATDNAGVAGYKITTSLNPAPLATDSGWSATMPGSYVYTGSINQGHDNSITLYAWAKDPSGNVSSPLSATVLLNCSPVIASFTVPVNTLFTAKSIPVTIVGTSSATTGSLQYLVTETPAVPPATAAWKTVAAPAVSYQGTYDLQSLTQAPGGQYFVPLYAWVKDANGISSSVMNTVTISDLPQVTSFSVNSPVVTGRTVVVGSLSGQAAPGRKIVGYYVSASSFTPPSSGFSATPPATFYYSWLSSGVPAIKTICAWVQDDKGFISQAGMVQVRFNSP